MPHILYFADTKLQTGMKHIIRFYKMTNRKIALKLPIQPKEKLLAKLLVDYEPFSNNTGWLF